MKDIHVEIYVKTYTEEQFVYYNIIINYNFIYFHVHF